MSATTTLPTPPPITIPEVRSGVKLVGLERDAFLFPGSSVAIETPKPLDRESAQRAIGVARADNAVKVGPKARRATWTPPADLAPGRHVLQVGPLIGADGSEISPEVSIPFTFVETKARVPSNVAVESMMRFRVGANGPERLSLTSPTRGKYVEVMKGSDRRTNAPVELAFNEAGRRVNADRILREAEQKRVAKAGKLHEQLQTRLRAARRDELVHVAVWAQMDDEIEPDDKRELERVEREPRPPAVAARRAEAMAERGRMVAGIARELGARGLRVDDAAPVVFARLRKDAIQRLAKRREVAAVFLYDPEGIEDLQDSIAIANSDDVHAAGPKGAGVKVAVWENGPTSNANLVIEAKYKASPSTSDHSENVHAIIKNTEANKPHGHAPECKLHSANDKDLDALRWAVKEKGCTVINQSFHRSAEPKSASLSFDDVYKDWLALHWPYPTICQAAGNFWSGDPDNISPPSNEYVNHKGYNSLAVANHDDSAAGMASSSVFRNPPSSHGDRELPELAANGTGVAADGITMTGTSQASPAAAGVTALLQSANATLKSWPEGCRAILLAGATKNVVGDTWWQDVVDDDDASDGGGAVNAYESHQIVKNRRSRNAAPTRRGWDVGTLQSSDFDAQRLSTFSYKIQAPSFWFGPRHVKVALAWDSKVTTFSIFGIEIPLTSQLTVDLDLKIFDSRGTQVGYSGSWDNSYEIAEFDAIPGETYEIRIRRWSGTDWTWYGIAWTVTGSLLDLGTILGAGPSRLRQAAELLPRMNDGD
jgi:hypothetical protein